MIEVRPAHADDVAYMDSLQRKHSHELGFLTTEAMNAYVKFYRVSLGLLNGSPACYLLGRDACPSHPNGANIYQACVQYDARHRALGSALVEHFMGGLAALSDHVVLWCAQDIEANLFWEACGFTAMAWRLGKQAKQRLHILWHRATDPLNRPSTFEVPGTSTAGQLRKTRIIVPLEAGQTWLDVKPERRPDVIAQAWPERPKKARAARKAPAIVIPTFPMLIGGRIVQRPMKVGT